MTIKKTVLEKIKSSVHSTLYIQRISESVGKIRLIEAEAFE